jgi:hypothetical protein
VINIVCGQKGMIHIVGLLWFLSWTRGRIAQLHDCQSRGLPACAPYDKKKHFRHKAFANASLSWKPKYFFVHNMINK